MSNEFELQDELQSLQDIPSYEIPNEHDIHDTEPGPLLQRASTRNLRTHVQVVSDHPVSQMPSTEPPTTRKTSLTWRYSTSSAVYLNTQTQSPARS